jgi:hypothetical protein
LVVKVPWVTVNEPEVEKASLRDKTFAELFTLKDAAIIFPFEVMEVLLAPCALIVPVYVQVIPDPTVRFPSIFMVLAPEKVPVNPVKFRFKQAPVTPEIVTVTAPEAAVKNTLSALVGTAAPPAPPSVVAHFVPAVVFHVLVPPTQ